MTVGTRASPATLDLRGLKCPLPVLRARKALAALPSGVTLLVLATDPMAAIDIPHMVRADGHALIGGPADRDDGGFLIRAR